MPALLRREIRAEGPSGVSALAPGRPRPFHSPPYLTPYLTSPPLRGGLEDMLEECAAYSSHVRARASAMRRMCALKGAACARCPPSPPTALSPGADARPFDAPLPS